MVGGAPARYWSQIGPSAVVAKFQRRHHPIPSKFRQEPQVTRTLDWRRFFMCAESRSPGKGCEGTAKP